MGRLSKHRGGTSPGLEGRKASLRQQPLRHSKPMCLLNEGSEPAESLTAVQGQAELGELIVPCPPKIVLKGQALGLWSLRPALRLHLAS